MEADAAAGGGHSIKRKSSTPKASSNKKARNKNVWPQHPHIRDPERRAKAYIRTAGLDEKSIATAATSIHPEHNTPELKFGRLLGGTDQRVRHKALLQLQTYLKARCAGDGLSELDLLKLWKGLWYTLYMADKAVVQEQVSRQIVKLIWCVAGTEEEDEYAGQAYLYMFGDDAEFGEENDAREAERLDEEGIADVDVSEEEEEESDDESADSDDSSEMQVVEMTAGDSAEESEDEDQELDDSETPHCRGAHLASLFVRTFFHTVKEGWGKMDKYRVDKFYTLVRFMTEEIYLYMAKRHWNLGIVRLFNDAVFEEILSQTPNGLRFHLIDICLDELAKVNAKAPMSLTEATFLDVMEPYFGLMQSGAGDDSVQSRVVENVMEKFLLEYSVVSENAVELKDGDSHSEKQDLVMDRVHVGTVAQFIFQVASDGATRDSYRRNLYNLHKMYVRRVKKVGRDVALDENAEDDPEDKFEPLVEEDREIRDGSNGEEQEEEENSKEDEGPKKTSSVTKVTASHDESDPFDPKEEEADERKSKKKRKNKKRKKRSDHPQEDVVEEEITISLKDQAEAKAALALEKVLPRNQLTAAKEPRENEERKVTTDKKSVKFGSANFSRSWVASMKGLRKAQPSTRDVVPSRGVLLNKDAKIVVNKPTLIPKHKGKSKGKKRRFRSYF